MPLLFCYSSGMKTQPKLTRKQQAFVQELLANPKQSGTQAALKVYGKPDKPTTYATADTISRANLENPLIMAALHDQALEAENTVIDVMQSSRKQAANSPKFGAVALAAANSLLDRVHGKPTQRMEVQSTAVGITIDLTGLTLDNSDNQEATLNKGSA